MSTGKRYKFFGSTFEVGTGLGNPITVTGASAADPVVLTATQSLDIGDVVKLANFDAPSQLDGQSFVVDNPSGSDFELAGVDGTDYDSFNAGTPNAQATPYTWTEFCELTASNQADGAPTEEDVSTICSTAKEFEQGLSDSGTLQLDFNWAGNETVQAALKAAKLSGDQIPFRITVANGGGIVVMIGTVQTTSMTGGVGQAVWKGSATVKLSGEVFVFEAP
jgi:hypothetical protein